MQAIVCWTRLRGCAIGHSNGPIIANASSSSPVHANLKSVLCQGYQMHRSTINIFTCSPCFVCPAHRVMWVLEAGLGHASGHRSPLSPLATTQEKWRGDSLDKPLIVKRKDPARVTSVSVTQLCPPVRSASISARSFQSHSRQQVIILSVADKFLSAAKF